MTDLIASLSSDGSNWGHIKKLVEEGDFEKVFVICPEDSPNRFSCAKPVNLVLFDDNKPVSIVVNSLMAQLKNQFGFGEVALNIVSGSGKDHMALLSAIMKLGIGYRLVAVTKDGVCEL